MVGSVDQSLIHWDEMGERKYLGPKIIRETTEVMEKIRKRIPAV